MRFFVANSTLLAFAFAVLPIGIVRADDAGLEFFEKKIRPVLVQHCGECHATGAKKIGGGLLLDHRDGVRKGGDSGPAIEPGKPEESLLIQALKHADDAPKMPPKGKLPPAVIADFEEWVKLGAPDPREKPAAIKVEEPWEETFRRRSAWWSLQPVRKPTAPEPRNAGWSQDPVDRFLEARRQEQGLEPAAAAGPRTLARRLSLVLTGLPPTPEQVEAFVLECGAVAAAEPLPRAAVERLVDSLLASPHFGERWARHWLDVVHFSETHGNEWNYEVHHAWRYRDYLIRAFNADVPYDQLIREHVAGDLLPQPRWNEREQHNESVIGTGFYRFGEVNHDDCISLRQIGYDLADNQIDTLTKAFQATTVACARCHNHKLDAVSMDDYYALLGVLRSSRLVSHPIDAPDAIANTAKALREMKRELKREIASIWLQDATQIPRYMQAAQAQHAKSPNAADLAQGLDAKRLEKWVAILAAEKFPLEDPLDAWRTLSAATAADAAMFPAEWRKWADKVELEHRNRTEFNKQFVTFADFRPAPVTVQTASVPTSDGPTVGRQPPDCGENAPAAVVPAGLTADGANWQSAGRAFYEPATPTGELVLHPEGDLLVRAVLPAGRFTHVLSDKLNGTLRSPVLPLGKAKISFQVVGQRSSAVRLVSNNCQLNYTNYRALTSSELTWVTFSPPDERESLRTYAELMTMFDNPKFPDQLSSLGGDKDNYRMPWDKAAANPRSYFGITRAVLHDCAEPPAVELAHLRRLADGDAPDSMGALLNRYVTVLQAALQAWQADTATDDDVRWLDTFLRRELLSNAVTQSPAREALAKRYRETEAGILPPRVIAGVGDAGPGIAQPVFVRGDSQHPGQAVPRRYLQTLSKPGELFTGAGSGRWELAQRIADPHNPLTSRVMVNRIWHHLFGTGLVRTVDDFGHVGELPSHPELLDYLATRFMDEGWSIKRMIRALVLTRTFQLSNQPSPRAREVDPQNRLLQHYPARRMEAEAVRDSILAASGRLDGTLYGYSVQPFREKEYADRRLFPGPLDGHGRRSIYIKNNLMEAPKFLGAFNFPGGKVTQGRRDVTNVPAQALALLNDPFVLQQAGVWSARLIARPNDTLPARVDALFQTALNRPPTDEERARFQQTIGELASLHQVDSSNVLASQPVWTDVAHALFNLNEFIHIP